MPKPELVITMLTETEHATLRYKRSGWQNRLETVCGFILESPYAWTAPSDGSLDADLRVLDRSRLSKGQFRVNEEVEGGHYILRKGTIGRYQLYGVPVDNSREELEKYLEPTDVRNYAGLRRLAFFDLQEPVSQTRPWRPAPELSGVAEITQSDADVLGVASIGLQRYVETDAATMLTEIESTRNTVVAVENAIRDQYEEQQKMLRTWFRSLYPNRW